MLRFSIVESSTWRIDSKTEHALISAVPHHNGGA
jgi:hypothetical protein